MRLTLVPWTGPKGRPAIVLARLPVVVTRLPHPGLATGAYTVSDRHCELDEEDGMLVVRDLGSKHGTFVNQSRVTRAYVWPGDVITVGLNRFLVRYEIESRGARARGNRAAGRPAAWPTTEGLSQGTGAGGAPACG